MLRLRPLRIVLPLLTLAVLPLAARAADKLPSDDRVKTGKLPNGVTWMYRQHNVPPGKMALLIHVDTGALNETDDQRGLSHFLEHMAFNGTENFKPGDLIPYFESIGMEFGTDLNAFTGFDQTVYMLFLPDTQVPTVDKGLMVLSDYAFRQTLLDKELDDERGVILSELRSGQGPEQRIRDKFFERVFDGMRVGQRLPIGVEKVISGAPRAEFEKYYRTWYRPERVTVFLVGDAPVDAYLPSLEKWFGTYKAALPNETDKGTGFKPFTQQRAIVLSDPEYAEGEVALYNLAAGRPPVTTAADYRVQLIDEVGGWIMERRFSDLIKRGQASFREASVGTSSFLSEILLSEASVTGEPKDWEKMLDQLVFEVNRALEFGFLEQELALARTDFLSSAEDAVRKEATLPARAVVMGLVRAVNAKEPILSAAAKLDLAKNILPALKLDEINAAFRAHYKPDALTFVVTLPQNDAVKLPADEALLAAAKAALAKKAEAPQWEERPTTLLDKEPKPGKLGEAVTDPDLQITSAWLDNGVRVHHRFMDYKKDLVLLSITLAGGEIEETAANTGVTAIAALLFGQPATNRLRSTDIQDIMTGKNIRVGGNAANDTFTLSITGSPKDLESGLQLAYALLTDGKLEQTAFDNWKQGALQEYERNSKQTMFYAQKAMMELTSGNDPRRTVWTPEKINAQSLARGQAWFNHLAKDAPIEVAVVGELKLDEVTPLLEKYLGALPKRARTAEHLDKLRELKRAPGPLERTEQVETITPMAIVLAGFVSPDAGHVADVRALDLAALTLDTRLIKRIREELGMVYSIGVMTRPSFAYKDSGFFGSGAPCAPDKGPEVVKEVETIYTAYAQSGPTAEELENAKKQKANELDTQLKEPSYWFNQLQALDLHKLKLDDLKKINETYAALTAEQVQKVFAQYYTPARTIRVIAAPKNVPAGETDAAPQPDHGTAGAPGDKPAPKTPAKP
jgi:zinc protease